MARALALQARGHRFESDILHERSARLRVRERGGVLEGRAARVERPNKPIDQFDQSTDKPAGGFRSGSTPELSAKRQEGEKADYSSSAEVPR